MTTNQTTLAANLRRSEALAAAIGRIEEIMLPGALALAGTRTAESPYWLDHDCDLSGRAPFIGRTVLCWRDQGTEYDKSRPFDGERDTFRVQVIVDPKITPAQLEELARLAAIYTADLIRECTAKTAAQVAALEADVVAFQAVARPSE